MARVDPAWGTEHLAAITRLEDKLGRPVCGHFTQTGPCSLAPETDGRCAAHAGIVFGVGGVGGVGAAMKRNSTARAQTSLRTVLYTLAAVAIALGIVGAISRLSRDPAEEIYRQAVALIAAGRKSEADPLLDLLIRDYHGTQYALQAKEIRSGVRRTSGDAVEQLYNDARNFYLGGRRSDYEEAARRYLVVVEKYPTDPLARDAMYEAVLCMDHLGKTTETIRLWKQFLSDYPDDGRAPEAMYALGFIHYTQLGKQDEGRVWFEELIRKFPDSSSADAARATLGLPLQSDTGPASAQSSQATPGTPGTQTTPGTSVAPPAQSGPPSVMTTPGQL